jgi:hypothetical protein
MERDRFWLSNEQFVRISPLPADRRVRGSRHLAVRGARRALAPFNWGIALTRSTPNRESTIVLVPHSAAVARPEAGNGATRGLGGTLNGAGRSGRSNREEKAL